MATNAKKQLGQRGEQIAAAYLQSQGYTLITKNWRCVQGEIDLIVKQGATFVFVEVRTRRADSAERAFESITPTKQKRLRALAYAYLTANQLHDVDWRVDLIAIAIPRSGQPVIEHVENGLDW